MAIRKPTPFGGTPTDGWRSVWPLIFVALAWIPPCLFGREPRKPDEGYTIGLVHRMVESVDWIVPNLTGAPFMEKPPAILITSALFADAFSPRLLPVHQCAVLAAALYVDLTLAFVYLSGREAGGRRGGMAAAIYGLALENHRRGGRRVL